MKLRSSNIQTIYLVLMLLNTLAASFIYGINTLFLLDAGLTNAEAFTANAFFTVGEVLFEIPTGIIADTWGRRTSYLLGTLTLSISTLLYLLAWQIHAPFIGWAVTSMLLGLGFTFFSGATDAWLVDALKFTGFKGTLESVFAKGQIVGGVAMLVGSTAGGLIAQTTDLGVPYILRAAVLGITFLVAFIFMKDLGFKPNHSKNPVNDIKKIFSTSVRVAFRNPCLKWVMLEAPFTMGVGYYVFYAMQPHLLNLYGDSKAYGIAGLAASIVAGAQIAGGFAVPYVRKYFRRRTSMLLLTVVLNAILLVSLGLTTSFPVAIILLVLWGLLFALRMPVRQAYMNDLIPSEQRATVLSFDTLMGSSGGVVIVPVLGKSADIWSYPVTYIMSGAIQALAAPILLIARIRDPGADKIHEARKL